MDRPSCVLQSGMVERTSVLYLAEVAGILHYVFLLASWVLSSLQISLMLISNPLN